MTRERGIMVRTLDLTGMTAAPFYSYALATVGSESYVICSEGVGWLVSDDEPLYVDTMAGEVVVILADVLTAARQGADVDLADFVRSFGDRLECNFYLWHRKLNGK
jgi:hypothetical protein